MRATRSSNCHILDSVKGFNAASYILQYFKFVLEIWLDTKFGCADRTYLNMWLDLYPEQFLHSTFVLNQTTNNWVNLKFDCKNDGPLNLCHNLNLHTDIKR
jgi:hypothetical protein